MNPNLIYLVPNCSSISLFLTTQTRVWSVPGAAHPALWRELTRSSGSALARGWCSSQIPCKGQSPEERLSPALHCLPIRGEEPWLWHFSAPLYSAFLTELNMT